MITRTLLAMTAGGLLAACQPAIPDSGNVNTGRGVGFGDGSFEAEQRARDAALAGDGSYMPAASEVTAQPLDDGSPEATAAETARVLAATRPGGASNGLGNDAATNSGVAPVNASPSNPPPAAVNAVGDAAPGRTDPQAFCHRGNVLWIDQCRGPRNSGYRDEPSRWEI